MLNKKESTNSQQIGRKGVKLIAIGGLVLIGLVATAPVGGAVLGSTIMLGTISLDPFVWIVVGLGSIGVLASKK